MEKDVKIEARSVITSHELERLKDSANLKLHALKSSSAIKDSETAEAEKLINEVNDRFGGEKAPKMVGCIFRLTFAVLS